MNTGSKIIGVLLVVVLVIGLVAVSGACWTYALNAWLGVFGRDATVQLWQGMILAVIPGIGQAGIPFAVTTWILMLFLV